MNFLVVESDFEELPAEDFHRWLVLEKVIRSRLVDRLEGATEVDADRLKLHYMDLIVDIANTYGVQGVAIENGTSINDILDKFLRRVSTAQARIWSSSRASYPFGRVSIPSSTKATILTLVHQVELQIDNWTISEARKKALHNCLENFRREIREERTRIGYALSEIAKVAAVAALCVSVLADVPDAFAAIQIILGAEQLEQSGSEFRLLEIEKASLLPPPLRQIEDQTESLA